MKFAIVFCIIFCCSCSESTRWPGGRIPYVLSGFSEQEQQNIARAMAMWSIAGVKFEPYPIPDCETKPLIIARGGVEQSLGMTIGGTGYHEGSIVTLNDTNITTIAHELGHVLGLQHENQRPDAQLYIDIQFDDIKLAYNNNLLILMQFLPLSPNVYDYDWNDVPYDYNSIMHYNCFIIAKDKSVTQLGNTEPSPLDILKIKKIYKEEIE